MDLTIVAIIFTMISLISGIMLLMRGDEVKNVYKTQDEAPWYIAYTFGIGNNTTLLGTILELILVRIIGQAVWFSCAVVVRSLSYIVTPIMYLLYEMVLKDTDPFNVFWKENIFRWNDQIYSEDR